MNNSQQHSYDLFQLSSKSKLCFKKLLLWRDQTGRHKWGFSFKHLESKLIRRNSEFCQLSFVNSDCIIISLVIHKILILNFQYFTLEACWIEYCKFFIKAFFDSIDSCNLAFTALITFGSIFDCLIICWSCVSYKLTSGLFLIVKFVITLISSISLSPPSFLDKATFLASAWLLTSTVTLSNLVSNSFFSLITYTKNSLSFSQ